MADARLDGFETWLFDLDNTLYPATCDLFSQIDVRMRSYIAAYLGVDDDAAFALQKQYFHDYGTSLRGLMDLHGMDPGPFLAHVHEIDVSVIEPDPALDRALARLPGRKLIFTNATTAHASRVLDRLGIAHHFPEIFDVEAAGHRPKPTPAVYREVVARFGLDPLRSIMIDDIPRNLAPAAALGMTTAWVRSSAPHAEWGADGAHIHHVVDDLPAWLDEFVAGAG